MVVISHVYTLPKLLMFDPYSINLSNDSHPGLGHIADKHLCLMMEERSKYANTEWLKGVGQNLD